MLQWKQVYGEDGYWFASSPAFNYDIALTPSGYELSWEATHGEEGGGRRKFRSLEEAKTHAHSIELHYKWGGRASENYPGPFDSHWRVEYLDAHGQRRQALPITDTEANARKAAPRGSQVLSVHKVKPFGNPLADKKVWVAAGIAAGAAALLGLLLYATSKPAAAAANAKERYHVRAMRPAPPSGADPPSVADIQAELQMGFTQFLGAAGSWVVSNVVATATSVDFDVVGAPGMQHQIETVMANASAATYATVTDLGPA
jgi:hypothetical protein